MNAEANGIPPDLLVAQHEAAGSGYCQGGMTLKEVARRLRAFCRRRGDKPHFGWTRRPEREARRVDLRRHLQHAQPTGVRPFRVKNSDPWSLL